MKHTSTLCFLVAAVAGALRAAAFAPISTGRGAVQHHTPADLHVLVVEQSSTALLAEPKFGDPDYEGDPTGLKRGALLLPIALAINIWMFSVPVEFRRARFCSEEQVRENPNSKCMTWETWRSGVSDYYANGGGVKFDFSIDPDGANSATGL